MKCGKCQKTIEDSEKYCKDCKKILNKENELNRLIDENRTLNKFEITKEVETLHDFKDEKKENSSSLKEELKDIVNIDEIELSLDGNSNKKNIMIVSIIVVSLIISIVIVVLVFDKPKQEIEVEEKINYEKVISDYGKTIELTVTKYLESNEEVPSWSIINDLVDYKEYRVICDTHHIYNDGTVYLNDCKINGKVTQHSYGIEKQDVKDGKQIEIYKIGNEDYSYDYKKGSNSLLVGVVTCKTDSCEFINAFDKYVLIKEDDKQYIYNYEDNSIVFGPVYMSAEYLVYDNQLYGMIYDENGKKNIYTLSTDKVFKNLDGELLLTVPFFDPSIMYKYGYVILKKDNKNNFINLKTGNISYSITGTLNSFIENPINKLVYMTTFNSENSKIIIYNSNGKKLFDGKEYNDIHLQNSSLIVSEDNNFYVYDLELKLKVKSKSYDEILDIYNKDFIIVLDNSRLKLVDLEDNELTMFDVTWDSEKYSYERQLSGWYSDNEIKIVIANKDSLSGILQNYIECYYNSQTKENNVIEKSE